MRPAIEPPYRWRDWASLEWGMTGDQLIAFINNEKITRPDGTEAPGLFAYLRGLAGNGSDRRDVIATVFKGATNRMINGYLLRDVINRVITSSEESADSTNRCCRRCATPLAILASPTRRHTHPPLPLLADARRSTDPMFR